MKLRLTGSEQKLATQRVTIARQPLAESNHYYIQRLPRMEQAGPKASTENTTERPPGLGGRSVV
jgi:hypothetical protein